MNGLFTIKMNGKKESVVSKINTFKGCYGAIRAVDGQVKLFKLVSVRPTRDPSRISLSILVKGKKGELPQKNWQMVRAVKSLEGEIQFSTSKSVKFWGNI